MQSSTPRLGPWSGNRIFSPTPNDLRVLVLDYLCHNSYSRSATAFAADSAVQHLDADGDEVMTSKEDMSSDELGEKLRIGELRKEIRTCIFSGQLDEALALLNEHFPSVLFVDNESLPQISSPDKFPYIPRTSIDPVHLGLNLRIQRFIEAARTIPLPYHPPSTSPSSESPASGKAERQDGDTSPNIQLLHRAQALYSEANSLPKADDRTLYLSELNRVCSLLAYKEPEFGPTATYMTQDRREAVAEQVDRAILYRLNEPTISKLELSTRYTTALWDALQQLKAKPPPRSAWPTGVLLPPVPGSVTGTTKSGTAGPETNVTNTGKKPGADPEPTEVVPRFDLNEFLRSIAS